LTTLSGSDWNLLLQSSVKKRIAGLYKLHKTGFKTCVSIEHYPTPNIIKQNIADILDALSFVDKIIFGRLNYNSKSSKYKNSKEFFNEMAAQAIAFAKKHGKKYHIKKGTVTKSSRYITTYPMAACAIKEESVTESLPY
jgi:DNA repair photolyase